MKSSDLSLFGFCLFCKNPVGDLYYLIFSNLMQTTITSRLPLTIVTYVISILAQCHADDTICHFALIFFLFYIILSKKINFIFWQLKRYSYIILMKMMLFLSISSLDMAPMIPRTLIWYTIASLRPTLIGQAIREPGSVVVAIPHPACERLRCSRCHLKWDKPSINSVPLSRKVGMSRSRLW